MEATRFAPSPTGYLHVGHAYSAWFSQRAARGGRFLLRIEDIDPTRCKPELIAPIFEDLKWLGLSWEEPVRKQSEHLDEYCAATDRLKAESLLYPCFCSRADIMQSNEQSGVKDGPGGPLYPGTCRAFSESEREDRIQSGQVFSLRLDMAKALRQTGKLTWSDRKAGEQIARPELFGDVIVVRKETPTSYHLSVVLDDALQNITLITRGTDLFEATDVHRVLQSLLGLPAPEYLHHPLLKSSDGKRLAKKFGSKTLRSYREDGEKPNSIIERFANLPDPG